MGASLPINAERADAVDSAVARASHSDLRAGQGACALDEPSAPPGWRVLATLSALLAFASISTDLYLPALPTMAQALHCRAEAMEWTISGYLIGFSVGQLVWGPIGDRYGRRWPVVAGLVLFIIGSAGCALSTSATGLIACRAVQAIGACAGVVLARAMVRDLYRGNRGAQMLSTLMTVMATAPLVGPLIGGQILVFASWRVIFWTLVAVGGVTLAAVLTLPETLPRHRRNLEPLVYAMVRYGQLLRRRSLMGYAGAGGFFFGATFAYIAGSPFSYESYHHVRPELYGFLFGLGVIGMMITNLINARLVLRLGSLRLLRFGTSVAGLATLALAIDARTGLGGLCGLVAPMFVFVSMTGFIVANCVAGALTESPERSGAVSALVGAIQYGSGILGSALVGVLADGTPWPMGLVIAFGGVGGAICAWTMISHSGEG